MSSRSKEKADAESAYEGLKEKLRKGTANRASAISLLNQIITDLPGTWIARLAKETLDEL